MLYKTPLLMVETERADNFLKYKEESFNLKKFLNFPIVCCPPTDPLDEIDKNKIIAKVLKAYINEKILFIEFDTDYPFKENNYINMISRCSRSDDGYIIFDEPTSIFIDELDINKSIWNFDEKRIIPLKILKLE